MWNFQQLKEKKIKYKVDALGFLLSVSQNAKFKTVEGKNLGGLLNFN